MDFPWHSGKVLEQLNHQRQLGLLCDCTFVVDGIDFKAHKSVLAACSAYFRNIFLDEKDVVHLDISYAAGTYTVGLDLLLFLPTFLDQTCTSFFFSLSFFSFLFLKKKQQQLSLLLYVQDLKGLTYPFYVSRFGPSP